MFPGSLLYLGLLLYILLLLFLAIPSHPINLGSCNDTTLSGRFYIIPHVFVFESTSFLSYNKYLDGLWFVDDTYEYLCNEYFLHGSLLIDRSALISLILHLH